MNDKNSIERAEPILETYDPNWEARWEKTNFALESVSKQVRAAYRSDLPAEDLVRQQKELLSKLHGDFHAQFRTASEYERWSIQNVVEQAETERKVLIFSELPSNVTVDEIRRRTASAYDMLREQDFITLPVGQPKDLDGFQVEPRHGSQRTTFHLSFDGFFNSPSEARCTIEQTPDKALVCFHHIPGSTGTSPTNDVEKLATGVKHVFLPHIRPNDITFFVHVPTVVGGSTFGEMFSRVDMKWSGAKYDNPEWTRFQQIPPAIREAELKPYDEPPLPRPPMQLASEGGSAPQDRRTRLIQGVRNLLRLKA